MLESAFWGGCLLLGGCLLPRGVCSGGVCSGGCLLPGGLLQGGVCSWGCLLLGGVSASGGCVCSWGTGVYLRGGCLPRSVGILLECLRVDIFPIPLLSAKCPKDVNFADLSFTLVSMDFALSFSHLIKSVSLSNWMIHVK